MKQIELAGKSLKQRLGWAVCIAVVYAVIGLPFNGYPLWPDAVGRFVVFGGTLVVVLLALEFFARRQRRRKRL
ncbi:hypothetical protein G3I40_42900 [Streptomyces sp. SID14478]|uniref:hypothetical protein n=1 Tax=Streptomyces sp. SID14478 TaxID=2706073 RepID=UPI0013DF69D5|nr:hypothetical protein [Streptomyces sp. SID14478]NEB81918.1 hypothetical protein [Streptomyces sp. SID14478]